MGKEKRLKDSQVLKAVAQHGADAGAIATALSISESNAFYRIRKLKERGSIDAMGTVVSVSPADIAHHAINADDKQAGNAPIVSVIRADVDTQALTPSVDENYKLRVTDAQIERQLNRKISVILTGEAGTGKTKSSEQLSAREQVPFLRVACDDNATLKEFIGRRDMINATTLYRTGLLTELLQKESVILFDEFNALPPSKLFFLHELLDNRRFFIRDADGGIIINVHEKCKIMLACNPNGARYSGTNKSNCALVDRCSVIELKPFLVDDISEVFESGSLLLTDCLKKYYVDAQEMIAKNRLRIVFSLRAVKRIAQALKAGDDVKTALEINFYNCALLTASDKEKQALSDLAKVIFGITETVPEQNKGSNNE